MASEGSPRRAASPGRAAGRRRRGGRRRGDRGRAPPGGRRHRQRDVRRSLRGQGLMSRLSSRSGGWRKPWAPTTRCSSPPRAGRALPGPRVCRDRGAGLGGPAAGRIEMPRRGRHCARAPSGRRAASTCAACRSSQPLVPLQRLVLLVRFLVLERLADRVLDLLALRPLDLDRSSASRAGRSGSRRSRAPRRGPPPRTGVAVGRAGRGHRIGGTGDLGHDIGRVDLDFDLDSGRRRDSSTASASAAFASAACAAFAAFASAEAAALASPPPLPPLRRRRWPRPRPLGKLRSSSRASARACATCACARRRAPARPRPCAPARRPAARRTGAGPACGPRGRGAARCARGRRRTSSRAAPAAAWSPASAARRTPRAPRACTPPCARSRRWPGRGGRSASPPAPAA